MSRVCQITGRRTRLGNKVARRGLAKAKGGVGIKTTGITRRTFKVNLQKQRLFVSELNQFVTVRLSVRALKSINKYGAYAVLLRAGLISPRRKHAKKANAAPAAKA